jgi:23S rRNA (guanosine2251-2'-O)-methyltransferase
MEKGPVENSREHILKLYKHCRDLEKKFDQVSDSEILKLKKTLQELAALPGPHTDKIAALGIHVKIGMSLQHFQNLIVPLERWLNRSLRDDEFLIRVEDQAKERTFFPLVLVLDHIRSAFNVGAFFRMADAMGIEKIILTGYTPTPQTLSVQKTALGSEDSVPWEWVDDLDNWLVKHQSSHQIIAWETSDKALQCDHSYEQKPSIFLFGNERFGLEKNRLKLCHEIREIQMQGLKNSMNVAQCAAIAAYEWRRQWLNSH